MTGRTSVGTTGGDAVRPARRRRLMPLIAAVAVTLLVGSIGVTSQDPPASASSASTRPGASGVPGQWMDHMQNERRQPGREARTASAGRNPGSHRSEP